MNVCLLCKQEFTEKRGLKEHYHKKQSCVPQRKIIELYKSIHKLLDFNLDYSNRKDKKQIQEVVDDIKVAVSNVELSPTYSNMMEYEKENMEHVKEAIPRFERVRDNAFRLYVKTLYCNSDSPENRVIKVTSMNGIFCKVFRNDNWELECYEDVMIELARNFWELMKESEDEGFQDHLLYIYQVAKKRDPRESRTFITYCKRYILPMLYNSTKNDKKFSYLIPNNNKKKVIKKKNIIK